LEKKVFLQIEGVAARDTRHEQHGLSHCLRIKQGLDCWEW